MFKAGIYKKEQLSEQRLYSFWGKRRYVTLALYNEFPGTEDQVERYQEHVINRVATANGSFKKTHSNRFDAFDDLSLSHIQKQYPGAQSLRVHDLAVSDGRTTVPYFKKLSDIYGESLKYKASDYAPYFKIIRRKGSPSHVVIDSDGTLIQFTVSPFVFNAVQPENKFVYPVNFIAREILRRKFVNPLLQNYKHDPQDIDVQDLSLLCSACQNLIDTDKRFTFEQYNILGPGNDRFDVVRAMNILNPSYFDEKKMKVAISNIHHSLETDGILITGSNMEQGTTVNGGIYRRTEKGFTLLEKSGEGSPVSDFLEV